jgi:catechol 2,3-dioxygenase-like lactoylglutathione lyase family enzyme
MDVPPPVRLARNRIHHIDLPVQNLARSRTFYELALEPLGIELVMHNRHPEGHEVLGFGQLPDPVFWIRNGRVFIGQLHVAFEAESRLAVDAFHSAAIQAGGTCNGAPGLRSRYAEDYYAAFVLDPDGHNVEAVCRRPA